MPMHFKYVEVDYIVFFKDRVENILRYFLKRNLKPKALVHKKVYWVILSI